MAKIKLMIVDDELISRNTIKKLLEDNGSYEVVADFSDGNAALDWLRGNDIDILLCDMQMPGMNGVELIRMIHVINEFLPVIAISAFDNFDYVRGSLVNGAANYLLKHELTRKHLISVLDQARDKYKIVPEERTIRHRVGYCFYDRKDFTADNIRSMADSGVLDFSCSNMAAIAISPDYSFPPGAKPADYKHDICEAVIDILGQILGKEYGYLIWQTRQEHLILLVSFTGVTSTLYMLNVIKNLAGRLQRQIIRMLDLTVTIICGNPQTDLKAAVKDAYEMDGLLEDKLYIGGNRVTAAAMARKLHYGTEDIPPNYWKQLAFELESGTGGTAETLNGFFCWMEEVRAPLKRVRDISQRLAGLIAGNREVDEKDRDAVLERIREYEILEQFREDILELYARSREAGPQPDGREYSPVIQQVLNYVRENFASDISLEKCAEVTGSSYTYLSRQFKQETGQRFVEYLNQQRVNKAKSLLIRRDMTMKEIIEQSGFRSYTYFFKIFKESEGLTPSEFMAKN